MEKNSEKNYFIFWKKISLFIERSSTKIEFSSSAAQGISSSTFQGHLIRALCLSEVNMIKCLYDISCNCGKRYEDKITDFVYTQLNVKTVLY